MPPAGTAAEAVAYARTFVGRIHETPPGSNCQRIGEMYGWNCVAYCAEGDVVVLRHVNVPVFETASAHLLINSGHDSEYGHLIWDFDKLELGDIIGWNFDADPNTIPNIHHVSMASAKPSGGQIKHIGFNTSPPQGGGTEWNGEGCWEKFYPASYFCCALRPHYSDASTGDGGKPKNVRFILERGDRGSDVRLWQRMLNIVDKAKIDVDGRFGAETVKATVRWQKAHDREPDGSVSLKTMRSLEQAIAKL